MYCSSHRLHVVNFDMMISVHQSLFEVKRRRGNMENIYTTAEPFLFLSKLFGLFPKSFVGQSRNGILKFKLFDAVFSVIASTFLAYLLALNLFGETTFSIDTQFVVKGWAICYISKYFIFLLLYVYQIYKRQNINKLLEQINSADQIVKSVKP